MRICIDGRMYGKDHAGIGRYVENLISKFKISAFTKVSASVPRSGTSVDKSVDKQNSKFKIFVLVRKDDSNIIRKNLDNNIELIIADARHYSLKEQFLIPYILYKNDFDLVHFPHFNVPVFYLKKYIVTIHDLLWHEMRGREVTTLNGVTYYFKYLGYRLVFANAVNRAQKILVPSNWVKKQLIDTYRIDRNKIKVTYEGIEETYKKAQSSKLKAQNTIKLFVKYKIKQPFIMYTGSAYPHKNLNFLVDALIKYNKNNKSQISLYIASSRNVFLDKLQNYINYQKANDFIKILGFVPDEELALLYREAIGFVFPSLSEGFGLGGLEAMACGCPVIASDISVLREVYQDGALYFNPKDKESLITQLKKLENENIRKKLLVQSQKVVLKYQWDKTVLETEKVYESCLGL